MIEKYKPEISQVNNNFREQLIHIIRYERYMEGESLETWARLLGPDVIGLTHPDFTAEITMDFIVFGHDHGNQLTADEEQLLLVATYVHDWGELKFGNQGVGDVTFEQKTAKDEKVEQKVFQKVLQSITNPDARNLIGTAYREVVEDKNSKLGIIFNVIERIGYVKTAIRTYQGIDGERIVNWRGLVGNVLSNQIKPLLEYSVEHAYVSDFIAKNSALLSRMLGEVAQDGVPKDNQGKPAYDNVKYIEGYNSWKDFQKNRKNSFEI
jgi:hypothetical protein